MARIAKSGLEYFPFDIDFFQDIRIRKLIKRQGGKAVTVYALLLCLIYKNGYYLQWDKELPFIGSELSGFDEAYISEVIKTCLMLGLFDKGVFEQENVLTSKGIQERYCNIQRLNKRMSRIDRYSLLKEPQQENTPRKKASKSKKTKPAQPIIPKPPVVAPPAPAPPPASKPKPPVDHTGTNAGWLTEFFADNHRENLNMLCMNFGLGVTDGVARLRALAEAVVSEWELTHVTHPNYNEWSRHLISTMRIKNRVVAYKPDNQQPSPPPDSDYTFKGGFGGQDI